MILQVYGSNSKLFQKLPNPVSTTDSPEKVQANSYQNWLTHSQLHNVPIIFPILSYVSQPDSELSSHA